MSPYRNILAEWCCAQVSGRCGAVAAATAVTAFFAKPGALSSSISGVTLLRSCAACVRFSERGEVILILVQPALPTALCHAQNRPDRPHAPKPACLHKVREAQQKECNKRAAHAAFACRLAV